MNKEQSQRLKKYLLFISIFFAFLLTSHILYIYLYYDAHETAQEGGSISEGVIGEFADLNPLKGTNDYNKNIISLLYRSLMKYDYEENKLVNDLANCSIDDLTRIECTIIPGTQWSNGEAIATKDLLSTFNVLKNSDINPPLASLLKNCKIEEIDGRIIFINTTPDISFLTVLTQPIASKDVLDNIGNNELFGKFNPLAGVFSGPYRVDTVSYDESLGVQKLLLIKNEKYSPNDIMVSKYIIKFFKDALHFNKQKDNVSVFFDQNQILNDSLPRLQKYTYTLNKYSSVFLNSQRLKDKELRNFILDKIDRKQILGVLPNLYYEVKNPFLSQAGDTHKIASNQNIENILKKLGYYKKSTLLEKLSKKEEVKPRVTEEPKKQEPKETPSLPTQKTLQTVLEPFQTSINTLQKDDVLIKGTTLGKKVTAVYVNDYKLTGYKSGNDLYYYRLKESYQTIKKGENSYKIEFMINGKRQLMDELIVYYGTKAPLEEATEATQSGELLSNNTLPQEKSQSGVTQSGVNNTGTLVLTGSGEVEKKGTKNANLERISKISALNDLYYYDSELNRYTLRLFYVDTQSDYVEVANIIKSSLGTFGIAVDIIPINKGELNEKLINDEKDYDLILAGIDSGYYPFNLYSYFHSTQAKGGYNFSALKNSKLDTLLESLKIEILPADKRKEIEQKAIAILRDEQTVKTLFSKENTVYIDKNIHNVKVLGHTPSSLGITQSLLQTYVVSEKTIKLADKSFGDFVTFIFGIFQNGGKLKK